MLITSTTFAATAMGADVQDVTDRPHDRGDQHGASGPAAARAPQRDGGEQQ